MKKIHSTAVLLAMFIATSCNTTKDQHEKGNMPSVDMLFKQMDANKDGKLSSSEVQGPLKNDFSKIDTDHDGFITKDELNKAPKPQGQGGPQGPPPNH